jgi:FHA domain
MREGNAEMVGSSDHCFLFFPRGGHGDPYRIPNTRMMMVDDDEAQQYALDATQTQQEVLNEATMHATSPSKAGGTGAAGTKPRSGAWGLVRRKGGNQEEFLLEHRLKDGKRDTYVIGRSTKADIVVNDGRVSAHHCAVYCDYSEARLRVFIEDMSANGTFVNDSLIRLTKGKRLELKTGDEIFLVNPRTLESRPGGTGNSAAFLYINLRERMFVERTIGYAPSSSSSSGAGGGYGTPESGRQHEKRQRPPQLPPPRPPPPPPQVLTAAGNSRKPPPAAPRPPQGTSGTVVRLFGVPRHVTKVPSIVTTCHPMRRVLCILQHLPSLPHTTQNGFAETMERCFIKIRFFVFEQRNGEGRTAVVYFRVQEGVDSFFYAFNNQRWWDNVCRVEYAHLEVRDGP